MIQHPSSSRHCAVEFQALPSRIGQVRRIVCAQLRYWRLDSLIDTAALAVTELLANVHRHTGPDKHCTVELVLLWDRLTVSVRDHDPRLPELRSAGGWATSGRGLALVAAVSASWGARAQRGGQGKVVWFSLPAPLSDTASGAPSPPAATAEPVAESVTDPVAVAEGAGAPAGLTEPTRRGEPVIAGPGEPELTG